MAVAREERSYVGGIRTLENLDLANRRYVSLLRDDDLEDDDPQEYEDLPTFHWDTTFDVGQIAASIEGKNHDLWTHLKVAICCKLGVPYAPSGWQGIILFEYSTSSSWRNVGVEPHLANIRGAIYPHMLSRPVV